MHVDGFIVCLFSSLRLKNKEQQKLAGDDGWTNIKHYANVNDQMNLF